MKLINENSPNFSSKNKLIRERERATFLAGDLIQNLKLIMMIIL